MSTCEECGTDHEALEEYIAELEARAEAAHAKGREAGLREAIKVAAEQWAMRCDPEPAIERLLEKR